MSDLHPVVPGLWRVELGVVNAYLLEDGDGLILIDTGYPSSETRLLDAVAELDRQPSDVRAVIVTHLHPDHAGSLAAVLDMTGAEAWMHPTDAAEVRVGNGFRPYTTSSGILNWVLERTLIQPGAKGFDPAPVAHEVEDGDAAPGGLRVVHAPGHSAGHIALVWPEHGGVLVAADACSNLPVLAPSVVYESIETGRRTLRRLAAMEVDVAVFGHGKPIMSGAAEKMRAAFG